MRLEVAVDCPCRMRAAQGGADLPGDPPRLVAAHRTAREPVAERHAPQPFHGEERPSGMLVHVENGHDSGTGDAPREIHLALEPLADDSVVGEMRVQGLQRQLPAVRVDGREDLGESPLPEPSVDPEPPGNHRPWREPRQKSLLPGGGPRRARRGHRGSTGASNRLEGRRAARRAWREPRTEWAPARRVRSARSGCARIGCAGAARTPGPRSIPAASP